MKSLYLHLGYPKTGTTFLQEEIFPVLPEMTVHSKPHSDVIVQRHPHDGILRRLFTASPVVWSELGSAFMDEVLETAASDVLLSEENITNVANEPALVSQHVASFFQLAGTYGFEGKILITIRQQAKKLGSAYAQNSHRFSPASQNHFEEFCQKLIDPNAAYYSGPRRGVMLDYHYLYTLIAEHVPEENISVLPFELMKEDLRQYAQSMLQFFGMNAEEADQVCATITASVQQKRNVRSISSRVWSLQKKELFSFWLRPGRLFRALNLPMKVSVPRPRLTDDSRIELTHELEEQIMATYESCNRKLSEVTGLDLERYDYF